MSLCSLRKSQPSAKPVCVSVNDFIDQANDYAHGVRTPRQNISTEQALAFNHKSSAAGKMKKLATFSLSEDAIRQLTALSARTGISRSRLIRILIAQQVEAGNDSGISRSEVL